MRGEGLTQKVQLKVGCVVLREGVLCVLLASQNCRSTSALREGFLRGRACSGEKVRSGYPELVNEVFAIEEEDGRKPSILSV